MLEVMTAIAATIAAVTGLVSAIFALIVDSRVDLLIKRVDKLERTVFNLVLRRTDD